ncbi:suppressor of fused domain protein [Ureibacillus composti]
MESHLGEIEYGWSKDEGNNKLPFQVVKFKNGPFSGTVTYSTLGLSNEKLLSPISNKEIHQELIIVADSTFGVRNIPGILQQVGLQALDKKEAYLRGDVIGPFGKIFNFTNLEALYVSIPVYFPDSFQIFHESKQQPIIQTWLVPITSKEAWFVRENGWEEFEDILEEIDPDLVDFQRKSIIK